MKKYAAFLISLLFVLPIQANQYSSNYQLIYSDVDEEANNLVFSDGSVWRFVNGKIPIKGEVHLRLDCRSSPSRLIAQIFWEDWLVGGTYKMNDRMAIIQLLKAPTKARKIVSIEHQNWSSHIMLDDGSKWRLVGFKSELSGWEAGQAVILSRDYSSSYYPHYFNMILMSEKEWKEAQFLLDP